MSHCHDEHADHNGHGHGDHDHEHDHSDDITPALQYSLYQHIRFDDIVTLNESERDAGKAVVKKTWSDRLQVEPELVSDADEQMIMNIPFTGQVKLHSILLRSSLSPSAPQKLQVFINRDDIDFDSVNQRKPTQEFELSQTSEVQELPVKRALFSSVRRLSLFFVNNFSTARYGSDNDSDSDSEDGEAEEATRLSYIGFKGEWMAIGRAPAQIIYEAAPNPNDHALKGTNANKMNSASRNS
ncbi:PITH domain-containing protein [Xylaria arbuscula]|nr:PITH domain-containing protein [Xylaria arbuscula]